MRKPAQLKTSSIIIHPFGGLCNRLRVILSAISEHKKIFVIWDKNPEIANTHFLDVFEPIPQLTFIEKGRGIRTCHEFNDSWRTNVKLLTPVNEIEKKVKAIRNSLNVSYIALHIRRTDFSDRLATQDYGMYFSFIESNNSQNNVYLATDNQDTLDVFKDRYPKRILNSSLFQSNSKRQTSLQDSVIDIVVCANATNFLGTEGSSFSEMIVSLSNNYLAIKE